MSDKDLDKLEYDKLIELIDSVKMYSGEELISSDFSLGEFKCENMGDMLDESRLYIIPIDGNKKVKIYG